MGNSQRTWTRICRSAIPAWVITCLLSAGCSLSSAPTPRIVTPTPIPSTPTATAQPAAASPTASPSSSPTAPATPPPTLDPIAIETAAGEGLSRIQASAGEAQPVCLRYEDTDIDGDPEWVALVHQDNGPSSRLSAFVLDGDETYHLEPALPKPGAAAVGFGQYATCEVIIRDVNADGTVEIAVFGYAEGNQTLLHLFAWDGQGYRRLGFFSGDAGVKFVDFDGDLEDEIWEGHRVPGAPSIAWYIVHTWENGTYGWTSEHYDWYFTDRPQTYPTHGPDYAVIAFYLALNDRDLEGAYNLLAPQGRDAYETWALGYSTTMRVSGGSAHTVPGASGEERARVAIMVTAWDNEGGVIVGRLWNVEWDTIRTEAGWRLLSSTAEQLEEWTVSYWP